MENTIRHHAFNYLSAHANNKDIFDLCIKTEGRKLKVAADLELLGNFVSTRGLDGSPKHTKDIVVATLVPQPEAKAPARIFRKSVTKRAKKTLDLLRFTEGSVTNEVAVFTGVTWAAAKATLDYLIQEGKVERIGSEYRIKA